MFIFQFQEQLLLSTEVFDEFMEQHKLIRFVAKCR